MPEYTPVISVLESDTRELISEDVASSSAGSSIAVINTSPGASDENDLDTIIGGNQNNSQKKEDLSRSEAIESLKNLKIRHLNAMLLPDDEKIAYFYGQELLDWEAERDASLKKLGLPNNLKKFNASSTRSSLNTTTPTNTTTTATTSTTTTTTTTITPSGVTFTTAGTLAYSTVTGHPLLSTKTIQKLTIKKLIKDPTITSLTTPSGVKLQPNGTLAFSTITGYPLISTETVQKARLEYFIDRLAIIAKSTT